MAENQVTASRNRNLSKRAVRSVTLMRPVDEFTMTPAPRPATGEDGRRRATVSREARRWLPRIHRLSFDDHPVWVILRVVGEGVPRSPVGRLCPRSPVRSWWTGGWVRLAAAGCSRW